MNTKKDIGRTRSSIAIEVAYRKKLMKLINDMQRSVRWFLGARYRANQDTIVVTDSATDDIVAELRKLFKSWSKKFNDAAKDINIWFIQQETRHAKSNVLRVLLFLDINVTNC